MMWFFLLALLLGVTALAFYFVQKTRNLNILLLEASGRIELTRRHSQRVESESFALQDNFLKTKKNLEESYTRIEQLKKENEAKSADFEAKVQALFSQTSEAKRHLAEGQTLLEERTLELRFLEKETRSFPNEEKQTLTEKNAALEALVAEKELKIQAQLLESEHLRRDLDDNKRRLSNAEHLYQTMKGLREMAEERNENWEKALTIFSKDILRKQNIAFQEGKLNLGELVGTALEALKEELITDPQGEGEPEAHV